MNDFLKYFNWEKYPYGFWNNIENVKLFMRFASFKLGYTKIEDWYKCTRDKLTELGGNQMFKKFKNLITILNLIYENKYNFLEWKFVQISPECWNDKKFQLKYMNWLYEKLNFNSMEDWYKITQNDLRNNYGRGLLYVFKESILNILNNVYEEYIWLPWKFYKIPGNYYDNDNNLILYMNWLYKELKFNSIEDWYNVTNDTFYKNHGSLILKKFNTSAYNVVINVYKEYEWLPWKFKKSPVNFWKDLNNQRKYLDWLFKKLNFKNKEDWYNVNQTDFNKNYGGGLMCLFGGFVSIIIKNYPELNLEKNKFNLLKGEFKLYNYLKEITNKEISSQTKFIWCKNPETNYYLPFDFCIEDLKILIELDGEQHFNQIYYWESPETVRKRDSYKMVKAKENGYTIIRLLWDDIYYDKNNWKLKLKNSIFFYDIPSVIFLSDIYKDYY
jgi:hypothetical protein